MISVPTLSDASEGLTAAWGCIPSCLLAIARIGSDVERVESMIIKRGWGEGIENER